MILSIYQRVGVNHRLVYDLAAFTFLFLRRYYKDWQILRTFEHFIELTSPELRQLQGTIDQLRQPIDTALVSLQVLQNPQRQEEEGYQQMCPQSFMGWRKLVHQSSRAISLLLHETPAHKTATDTKI